MPLILPARTLDTGGYEIDNSLRYNSPDIGRLGKTISGTSNRKTFSLSFWLKKSHNDGNGGIMGVGTASSDTGKLNIRITGSDFLKIEGGATTYRVTNRAFRDNSAWYNIFISFDSTQSTADNRISIYVNGVEETSFSTKNNPSQDANTPFNEDGKTHYIGTAGDGSAEPLDGYLAEFHYIDGTRKAHSDFGEFNDNGVWIPKAYDGSYGTHGFYFQFQDSGNLGDDTSGNGNDYTASNLTSTDQTTDTPTNNFCTMNPLDNFYASGVFAEGNLDLTTNASAYAFNTSTFGLDSGKWYWEAKVTNIGTGSDNWLLGITASPSISASEMLGQHNYSLSYRNNGNYKTSDANNTHGASFTNNDIVMFALDLDNDRLYLGHGGSWADGSGNTDESDLSNSNSIIDISGLRSTSKGTTVFIAFGDGNGNSSSTPSEAQLNFGNPPFAISSGNSDGAGFGNFEYAVPSGFYSLCTKNLAEYG